MTVADEELIAGYFRPITNFMAIQDETEEKTFAVFNDRPQAGVSRGPGSIEFIFERKTVSSDWKGVGEVTNDDYEGHFGYELWFLHTKDPNEVRKIQVEKDLEVLHIVGASNKTLLSPNSAIPEQKVPNSPGNPCVLIDVSPIEKQAIQFSLQVIFTNVCSMKTDKPTLGGLLSGYGLTASNILKIKFRTAEGILRKKEGKSYKPAMR